MTRNGSPHGTVPDFRIATPMGEREGAVPPRRVDVGAGGRAVPTFRYQETIGGGERQA
jgi:hypothetical protein